MKARDSLDRLFSSARQAAPREVPAPSAALEWRVMAAWRAGDADTDPVDPVFTLLRGGLIAGLAVSAAVLVFCLRSPGPSPMDELADSLPSIAQAYVP